MSRYRLVRIVGGISHSSITIGKTATFLPVSLFKAISSSRWHHSEVIEDFDTRNMRNLEPSIPLSIDLRIVSPSFIFSSSRQTVCPHDLRSEANLSANSRSL